VALDQEAGVVLMQGGGFQIYYQPTRAGHVPDAFVDTAGRVADFCRPRQAICHKSTSVPQVAVLLSNESRWERSDRVFHWGGCMDEVEGALHALLELHYSVDLLAEHQLQPCLADYPLVVVPDAHKLTDEFRQALTDYVEQSGSLMLLGEKCARLFEPLLGATLDGEPEQVTAELGTDEQAANLDGVWQRVVPTTAEVVAHRYPTFDTRKGGEVAATIASHGKGKVAAVYGPIALAYFRCHHPLMRGIIGTMARELFPSPMFQLDAPSSVDVALRRVADGRLCLHLLNLANAQRADRFLHTGHVPAATEMLLRLDLPKKPKRVTWLPEGEELEAFHVKGRTGIWLPDLDIHGVVVIE